MINRELQDITVNTFVTGVDAYGQKRQNGSSTRTIQGVAKKINATNVENPKYVDVELLVLTKDSQLTDANTLTINGKNYQIDYITDTRTWRMVFCEWLK